MLFVYLIYQCFGISFSLKSWIHEILILEYVIKSKCSLTSLSKADLTGTFYQAYFTMYPDTSLKSQVVLRIYFKQLFRLDKNNMASSLDSLFFFLLCSFMSDLCDGFRGFYPVQNVLWSLPQRTAKEMMDMLPCTSNKRDSTLLI